MSWEYIIWYIFLNDSESEFIYTILIFTADEYKKWYNIACVYEYMWQILRRYYAGSNADDWGRTKKKGFLLHNFCWFHFFVYISRIMILLIDDVQCLQVFHDTYFSFKPTQFLFTLKKNGLIMKKKKSLNKKKRCLLTHTIKKYVFLLFGCIFITAYYASELFQGWIVVEGEYQHI